MRLKTLCIAAILLLVFIISVRGDEPGPGARLSAATGFRSRLLSSTTRHLDLLLDSNGKVSALKGKSADGMTAFAFYLMFEMTGNQKYRGAALELADRILSDMKATPYGVLYIKQKQNDAGEKLAGGGPPAFGFYTAALACIYYREGGRAAELRYLASVLDKFPWNEKGWWAASIDVHTGQPKEPLEKPSIINKNAAMAMAAGMVSEYIQDLDPATAARLKKKTEQCIYRQIIPAQEADGFWHYSLSGNDPGNKDILGYFMLTAGALIQLRQFTGAWRDPVFSAALEKAESFASGVIAPMTDPNPGHAPPERFTPATPTHFTLSDDPKRGFALGLILFAGRHDEEGIKIMDCATQHFPYGNAGQDGAHAVYPSALILYRLHENSR